MRDWLAAESYPATLEKLQLKGYDDPVEAWRRASAAAAQRANAEFANSSAAGVLLPSMIDGHRFPAPIGPRGRPTTSPVSVAQRRGLGVSMPRAIFRAEVQRLMEQGAQVLDVLEVAEYREAHLPGAVHIHLRRLRQHALKKLDPARPVIVYCYDSA